MLLLGKRLMQCPNGMKAFFLGFVLSLFLSVTLMCADSAWGAPKYKVLHAFGSGKDGAGLFGALVLDHVGNLYGATSGGGVYGLGTVFQLTRHPSTGHWSEKVLHDFGPGGDGAGAMSALTPDVAGNLYGTTFTAGAHNAGMVFELSPSGGGKWTETALYSFCSQSNCSDGGTPFAGVILDNAGNLYGTTYGGGYGGGGGVVFQLSPGSNGSWTETVLYSFSRGGHGTGPLAGVIFDADGNLYGTTEFGTAGGGTAFEIIPGSGRNWKEQILHYFTGGNDGKYPYAGLIFDGAGNLYGTTLQGGGCGGACGTVYKLTPNVNGHWKETVLHNFSNVKNGADPAAGLVSDAAGNLYGTASGGGLGYGAVFKLTPSAGGKWKYTVLHRFTGQDGNEPQASVILDKKGNLYGTTVRGGPNDAGVVYEITP